MTRPWEPVVHVDSQADFDRWLAANGAIEREVIVGIYKAASGRQTVTLGDLQEVALRHGWVDTQIRRIDDERYAIRFVVRQKGSNWSATNRDLARRLLAEGRILAAGLETLPDDL